MDLAGPPLNFFLKLFIKTTHTLQRKRETGSLCRGSQWHRSEPQTVFLNSPFPGSFSPAPFFFFFLTVKKCIYWHSLYFKRGGGKALQDFLLKTINWLNKNPERIKSVSWRGWRAQRRGQGPSNSSRLWAPSLGPLLRLSCQDPHHQDKHFKKGHNINRIFFKLFFFSLSLFFLICRTVYFFSMG